MIITGLFIISIVSVSTFIIGIVTVQMCTCINNDNESVCSVLTNECTCEETVVLENGIVTIQTKKCSFCE
jgi:hypothetical protein